jgi:hypothetical protein
MTKEADVVRALKPYLMAFPSSHVKEDTLIIYARALSRLSPAEIEAAMAKLIETLAYFPAVAQIFEAAKSIKITAEGTAVPAAAEAWGEVMQQARKNGMDRKWEFSCPEVEYTLKMFGGKQMICMMQESDMPTCRAQFMRMYNEICEKQKTERENQEVLDRMPQKQRQALSGKIIQLAEAKKIAEGAA